MEGQREKARAKSAFEGGRKDREFSFDSDEAREAWRKSLSLEPNLEIEKKLGAREASEKK